MSCMRVGTVAKIKTRDGKAYESAAGTAPGSFRRQGYRSDGLPGSQAYVRHSSMQQEFVGPEAPRHACGCCRCLLRGNAQCARLLDPSPTGVSQASFQRLWCLPLRARRRSMCSFYVTRLEPVTACGCMWLHGIGTSQAFALLLSWQVVCPKSIFVFLDFPDNLVVRLAWLRLCRCPCCAWFPFSLPRR